MIASNHERYADLEEGLLSASEPAADYAALLAEAGSGVAPEAPFAFAGDADLDAVLATAFGGGEMAPAPLRLDLAALGVVLRSLPLAARLGPKAAAALHGLEDCSGEGAQKVTSAPPSDKLGAATPQARAELTVAGRPSSGKVVAEAQEVLTTPIATAGTTAAARPADPDDELDALLGASTVSPTVMVPTAAPPAAEPAEEEDLEQWLDDVLK